MDSEVVHGFDGGYDQSMEAVYTFITLILGAGLFWIVGWATDRDPDKGDPEGRPTVRYTLFDHVIGRPYWDRREDAAAAVLNKKSAE